MIQTGIRLDESSTVLVFPKIAPEELKPDDFILSLGVMEGIPAESLKSDPKLAYILSK